MKIIFFALFTAFFCKDVLALEEYGTRTNGEVIASLYYLIANPDEFRGKVIETYGVIDVDFEDNALFIDNESYKHFIRINSVVIDWNRSDVKIDEMAAKSLNGSWVRIIGKFYGSEPYKNECINGRNKAGQMCVLFRGPASGKLLEIKFIQKIDEIQ